MPAASPAAAPQLPFFWHPDAKPEEKDYHVAFRASFELPAAGEVEFRVFGATWFTGWIDGRYFCEGPPRFTPAFPEHQSFREKLSAGRHTLAIQVHQLNAPTRSLVPMDPFLGCAVQADGREIPLRWKCLRLAGYSSQVRVVNFQLGFIEWCDTRGIPDWTPAGFDDNAWIEPVAVTRALGPQRLLTCSNPHALPL